jgi:hypothetical protein
LQSKTAHGFVSQWAQAKCQHLILKGGETEDERLWDAHCVSYTSMSAPCHVSPGGKAPLCPGMVRDAMKCDEMPWTVQD